MSDLQKCFKIEMGLEMVGKRLEGGLDPALEMKRLVTSRPQSREIGAAKVVRDKETMKMTAGDAAIWRKSTVRAPAQIEKRPRCP